MYSQDDTQIAKAMLLKASDLPAGWKSASTQPTDELQLQTNQNACVGIGDPAQTESAYVNGTTLTSGKMSIFTNIIFTTNDELGSRRFAGFSDSVNFSCLANAENTDFQSHLSSVGATGVVSYTVFAPIPGFPNGGDTNGERMKFVVNTPTGQILIDLDYIVVAIHRTQFTYTVVYPDQAPPLALEQQLDQAAHNYASEQDVS